MTDQQMTTFARYAADTAMRGAAEYIRKHKLNLDLDAVIDELRQGIRDGFDDAMKQGRDAVDAGMLEIAQATVQASFKLIGIEAAKRVAERQQAQQRSQAVASIYSVMALPTL